MSHAVAGEAVWLVHAAVELHDALHVVVAEVLDVVFGGVRDAVLVLVVVGLGAGKRQELVGDDPVHVAVLQLLDVEGFFRVKGTAGKVPVQEAAVAGFHEALVVYE